MEVMTRQLHKELDEKTKHNSKTIKDKEDDIVHFKEKLKNVEGLIDKLQSSNKNAKETIEKQISDKNETLEKMQSLEAQNMKFKTKVDEKDNDIHALRKKLESMEKELRNKNDAEKDPEQNPSLQALKSLFEEKDTECTKAKNDLDAEKKRNSELLVTIKVLKELGGMPTTPSPSPSPSPSLSTPPLPPPLQPAHSAHRAVHTSQSPSLQSTIPNLMARPNVVSGQIGNAAPKRPSTTPPPLTVAPKIQRVIHISESPANPKLASPIAHETLNSKQSETAIITTVATSSETTEDANDVIVSDPSTRVMNAEKERQPEHATQLASTVPTSCRASSTYSTSATSQSSENVSSGSTSAPIISSSVTSSTPGL